jgi:hypothetical protein
MTADPTLADSLCRFCPIGGFNLLGAAISALVEKAAN